MSTHQLQTPGTVALGERRVDSSTGIITREEVERGGTVRVRGEQEERKLSKQEAHRLRKEQRKKEVS